LPVYLGKEKCLVTMSYNYLIPAQTFPVVVTTKLSWRKLKVAALVSLFDNKKIAHENHVELPNASVIASFANTPELFDNEIKSRTHSVGHCLPSSSSIK